MFSVLRKRWRTGADGADRGGRSGRKHRGSESIELDGVANRYEHGAPVLSVLRKRRRARRRGAGVSACVLPQPRLLSLSHCSSAASRCKTNQPRAELGGVTAKRRPGVARLKFGACVHFPWCDDDVGAVGRSLLLATGGGCLFGSGLLGRSLGGSGLLFG